MWFYLNISVGWASGEKVAVGVEIEGFDTGPVPSQRADHTSRLQVPHFDSSGSTARAHQFFCWRESHRFDGRCMAAEALQMK